MTCRELVIYLNQAAIDIQAKKYIKRSKKAYIRSRFEEAAIHLSHAYTLGSKYAVRALRTLISLKRTGSLQLREPQNSTELVFDQFLLVRAQDFRVLSKLADHFYYGSEFSGLQFERYSNAYRYYEASWRTTKDYYSLYSMGYMKQQGLGVERNRTAAREDFQAVFDASFHGKVSRAIMLPSLFGMVRISLGRWVVGLVEDARRFLGRLKAKE